MVYMILGGVMLINLLIAMMSHTYDVTQELAREPLRQVIFQKHLNKISIINLKNNYQRHSGQDKCLS